jgi:hypothetical protein
MDPIAKRAINRLNFSPPKTANTRSVPVKKPKTHPIAMEGKKHRDHSLPPLVYMAHELWQEF